MPLRRKTAEEKARRRAIGKNVGPFGALVLLALMIVFAGVALYGIWVFWPTQGPDGAGIVPQRMVHFFGYDRPLSDEKLFFLTVAFAGALGGMAHSLRSFSVYLGNRELKWSWVPFYVLKPVLGAVLATLMYFVLRGGLFSSSSSTEQASPYGFAAIAALTGLFTDQAVEKLKKVAEDVFEKLEPQKDHFEAQAPAVVAGEPAVSATEATLKGTVNTSNQVTTWFFEYGTDANYGAQTPTTTEPAGTEDAAVEATLTGLAAATEYHYRLVAQNATGTTKGEDATFTTAAG